MAQTFRMAGATLLLLASCGNPTGAKGGDNGPSERPVQALATDPAPSAAPVCEADAPESPCPIVGRWRIARVYDPAGEDPVADDRGMVGATLSVTANGDAPGVLQWDGPDTGQFDISDRCTGPYLSIPGESVGDPAALNTLRAALTAWSVTGDPGAARSIGCEQGQWTVPTNAAGDRYGIVLPMGDQVAIQWYEERFLLLDRIG